MRAASADRPDARQQSQNTFRISFVHPPVAPSLGRLHPAAGDDDMDHDRDVELIELGTASTATEGAVIGDPEEGTGYFPLGISDE